MSAFERALVVVAVTTIVGGAVATVFARGIRRAVDHVSRAPLLALGAVLVVLSATSVLVLTGTP